MKRHKNIFPYRALFLFLLLTASVLQAAEELHDWSKTPELFPGIKHVFLDTAKPRPLKINVIRVDLTRGDLRFMTVKKDPDWGKPMPDHPALPIRTRRITTRQFMLDAMARGNDMLLAVNATPWRPWQFPYDHTYAAKMGLVISDGVKIEEADGRPVFLITEKGEFQIREVKKEEDTSHIRLALSGFSTILERAPSGRRKEKPSRRGRLTGCRRTGVTCSS